jgi:predicted RNA binding protein YcfA (HicA-like mRNA interferase family)
MNRKLIITILSAQNDSNIKFNDLRKLLIQMGFIERIKGDHFIYKVADIPERINIQPNGNKAKSYQIRQIREIIIKYGLEAMYSD